MYFCMYKHFMCHYIYMHNLTILNYLAWFRLTNLAAIMKALFWLSSSSWYTSQMFPFVASFKFDLLPMTNRLWSHMWRGMTLFKDWQHISEIMQKDIHVSNFSAIEWRDLNGQSPESSCFVYELAEWRSKKRVYWLGFIIILKQ